jgi:serine/threonine protein phosphatase PrpC
MRDTLELPPVEYAERSDPGRDPDKQVNEDACGHRATRFGHLCVVCDGMGGHAAGREAAQLALASILELVEHGPEHVSPSEVLRSAIAEANQRVHGMHTSEVAAGRPGSTLVAMLLHARGTEVAHVGDSRAYLVHGGRIRRLTRDHSIVQELVDRGLLSLQQAAHHPEANRITRALGMSPDVEAEFLSQPVLHVAGDAFVLCTDGLCDLVEDQEILRIVGGEPAAQAVGKLVDLANARGGHDNVTVVVLRARESASASVGPVAPTVAQTSTQTEAATVPSSPTRLEPPPQGPLEAVPLPGDLVSSGADRPAARVPPLQRRTLDPTPPPSSTLRPSRPANPAVMIGVALAVAAVALLAVVLVSEVAERGGKRNATSGPAVFDLTASDGSADAYLPVAPESIALPPAAATPAEPIAPLDPPSALPVKHKH